MVHDDDNPAAMQCNPFNVGIGITIQKFVERLTYDMTDPAIISRSGFGVIDHVGRAVCRDGDGNPIEGWGLYEHGALGRHDPSGFADWLTVAP